MTETNPRAARRARVVSALVALAVTLVGCTALPASPAAVSVLWDTTAPVPGGDQPHSAVLGGIRCPSVSMCVAFGFDLDAAGRQQPLLLTDSGAGWRPHRPALPAAESAASVQDVSCAGADFCAAGIAAIDDEKVAHYLVDSRTDGGDTVAELPSTIGAHDDDPSVPAGALELSCWLPGHCVAALSVGGDSVPGFELFRLQDAQWTHVPTPRVTPSAGPESVDALACDPTGWCVVAGHLGANDSPIRAWAATLDGTAWSATVQQGLAISDDLQCPAVGRCLMLGDGSDQSILTVFTRGGPPERQSIAGRAHVQGFACAAGRCAYAGTDFVQTDDGQRWDGDLAVSDEAGGRVVTAKADPRGKNISLGLRGSVACPDASHCYAVGGVEDDPQSGQSSPLVQELAHDAWTATSPALPDGVGNGVLSTIACASATRCVALGQADGSVRP